MQKRPFKIHHLDHLMRRHHRRVIAVTITAIVLFILFIISVVYLPSKEFSEEPSLSLSSTPVKPLAAEDAASKTLAAKQISNKRITPPTVVLPNYQKVIVGNGESLSHIFDRLQVSQQQLYKIAALPKVKKVIKRMQPGQQLQFDINDQHQLITLIIPINGKEDLKIQRQADKFIAATVQHQYSVSSKLLTATIQSSLYQAGNKADIPNKILKDFTNIFSWKINFKRDIRHGDQFRVLYEELRNTKTNKIEPGDIIAAAYRHNNKIYYAFKYRDSRGRVGYYDQQGKSLRKAFRRSPINGGRISSPFSLHRKNPVLGIVRPHTGTDFAAPYGTPIHATGDGKIIFRGRKGGYGRCIVLDHGNGITTLYGHMSRFNRKYPSGSHVKMGDVIGYIGTSGVSTGPHVHYEYRVNHKYKNPMKVKLPNAAPIPSNEKAQYQEYVKQEMDKLDVSSLSS